MGVSFDHQTERSATGTGWLAAFDVGVLRLVRVAIGGLELGTLASGAWRALEPGERDALAPGAAGASPEPLP